MQSAPPQVAVDAAAADNASSEEQRYMEAFHASEALTVATKSGLYRLVSIARRTAGCCLTSLLAMYSGLLAWAIGSTSGVRCVRRTRDSVRVNSNVLAIKCVGTSERLTGCSLVITRRLTLLWTLGHVVSLARMSGMPSGRQLRDLQRLVS